ncbi:MAG: transposase [Pseudomonadota bacterium]|nr:transposase [Pseudomonadota bacterium]
MEHYAGLDVSLKEIWICVVDEDGKTIAHGACPADPEGVAGWFRTRSLAPHRIVHESGMLAIWLQRGLAALGLPATCIDARKAHKALSARLNKSDAADAEGLAQLARTGWFTPVHIRSMTGSVIPLSSSITMSMFPRMTAVGLLISCAIPAVSSPRAENFSAITSWLRVLCSSSRLFFKWVFLSFSSRVRSSTCCSRLSAAR